MPPLSPEKPALCAGCGGKIADRYYLLAVDKQWHLRCLKCCECKLALESELTCFAKDGSIYCKEDYYRRFSVQRCARCHLGISASEMVMRARDSVYHLSCFTCSTCNKTLTTGDHFGMKDSLVYCRAHFETLLQGEYTPQLSYTELAAKSGGLALPYFNGAGTVQKGRPRKRKSPALGVDIVSYNSAGAPPGFANPPLEVGLRTALAVPEAGALVWGHGAQHAYLGSFDAWPPGQAGQGTNCSLLIEDDIGISSH
ncbi:LIM/homeobox protein Lhx9, partial [Eschrichtius robustus]|nr:LIM/homeobox protein Lhx9 [Eschrichtius robustus]